MTKNITLMANIKYLTQNLKTLTKIEGGEFNVVNHHYRIYILSL